VKEHHRRASLVAADAARAAQRDVQFELERETDRRKQKEYGPFPFFSLNPSRTHLTPHPPSLHLF
jgi:hypothetical protein